MYALMCSKLDLIVKKASCPMEIGCNQFLTPLINENTLLGFYHSVKIRHFYGNAIKPTLYEVTLLSCLDATNEPCKCTSPALPFQ